MEILEIKTSEPYLSSLQSLLTDCVESGASIGFTLPVLSSEINQYWTQVARDLTMKSRRLFIAIEAGEVVGSVQLALCHKTNGLHRGEVEKLMVKRSARGLGLSKKLMAFMEASALASNLSLLVLDTRLGDVASILYKAIGYVEAGQIPDFACNSAGELEATVLFYKKLC